MAMSLYELDKRYLETIESGFSIDEETGEVLFDTDNIDKLEDDINNKIDNIACYIKDLNGLNDNITNEIKALQERKKANDIKADKLKDYIKQSMMIRNQSKYESAKNKISFRKSTSLLVDDESKIQDESLFNIKVEKKLDKKKVTSLLKEGKKIEGCKLQENINLQIK